MFYKESKNAYNELSRTNIGGEKMNQLQLEVMKKRPGFIAALDQSGGSTPKALKGYGIKEDAYHNDDEMFALIHEMRSRVITSKAFTSEHILAAILFEKTMDGKIMGKFTADYLWDEKQIVPILKIDKGLKDAQDGVKLMKDMPTLDDLLARANKRHIFGTKERSVIDAANPKGIHAIVEQQFEVAKKVISYDLVPIIEPEVTITIPDKKEAEALLLQELKAGLAKLGPNDKVIFKLSIPTVPSLYDKLASDPHVVRIVALSGGYSQKEANLKLKDNKKMVASFSRALLQDLRYQQSQAEFDDTLNKAILGIYDASVNKNK